MKQPNFILRTHRRYARQLQRVATPRDGMRCRRLVRLPYEPREAARLK